MGESMQVGDLVIRDDGRHKPVMAIIIKKNDDMCTVRFLNGVYGSYWEWQLELVCE